MTAAVTCALKEGYRQIDCAWYGLQCLHERVLFADLGKRAYGNEKEVGEGIRASGVSRSEIFVRGCLSFFTQQLSV